MIVYKVCRVLFVTSDHCQYVSLVVNSKQACVEYRIGETTRPDVKGSLLFAYDTYERALSVVNDRQTTPGRVNCVQLSTATAVLECEAVASEKQRPPRVLGPFCEEETQQYWDDWNMIQRLSASAHVQMKPGTVLCESITPVRVMEE